VRVVPKRALRNLILFRVDFIISLLGISRRKFKNKVKLNSELILCIMILNDIS
jgi:hypothetical protein